MNTILRFCTLLLSLISCSEIVYAGQNVQKSNLTYLGAFRVPKGSLGGASGVNALTLRNGETMQPIAYNPVRNSLIALSYPIDKLVVEISIPPLVKSTNINDLNTATVLQVPVNPTNGMWDNVSSNGSVVPGATGAEGGYPGGLMVYNNKLIGTSWLYYDGSGNNSWRSHFTASINWSTEGGPKPSSLRQVGTRLIYPDLANGGFVGGYMTPVPLEWQAALGGTALTGLAKIPIVSRSSFGPSIWSFDPDKLEDTSVPVQATALIAYPEGYETLGKYSDAPSLYYNRSGGYGGIVFPDGTDSIMVIGHHGLGIELDAQGVPLSNNLTCVGAGTSDRGEVRTNAWLQTNSPAGWMCGATLMTSQSIINGDSCCLDPANTASSGLHSYPYVVGTGQSCYGIGTTDISKVRSSAWLKKNSPAGWTCGSHNLDANAIAADSACCYDASPSGSDKGGKSYPYVYQIWKYNANDLAKVRSGTLNPATGKPYKPWDIIPEIIYIDLPFAPATKQILGATYDPSKQIIYIAQFNGDGVYSLIHAFKINNVPVSPKNLQGTIVK